jgi:hypothetical protein
MKEVKVQTKVPKTPKRKNTAPEKSLLLLPPKKSGILSAQFSLAFPTSVIEAKIKAIVSNTVGFDFKCVGQSSQAWYIAIYGDALGPQQLVVPETYAKLWVAMHDYPNETVLVVVPEANGTILGIGMGEPFMELQTNLNLSETPESAINATVSSIISDFQQQAMSATEITKTIITEPVTPEVLALFPYPEVVSVDPHRYHGDLSLNPKYANKNKFTFDSFLSRLPAIGKTFFKEFATFVLILSFAMPVVVTGAVIKHLYAENNASLQKDIARLQASKKVFATAMGNLQNEQQLILQTESASKSVVFTDYASMLSKVLATNVATVSTDGKTMSITLNATSPHEIDGAVQRLLDTGLFASFAPGVRTAGSQVVTLQGVLKNAPQPEQPAQTPQTPSETSPTLPKGVPSGL